MGPAWSREQKMDGAGAANKSLAQVFVGSATLGKGLILSVLQFSRL